MSFFSIYWSATSTSYIHLLLYDRIRYSFEAPNTSCSISAKISKFRRRVISTGTCMIQSYSVARALPSLTTHIFDKFHQYSMQSSFRPIAGLIAFKGQNHTIVFTVLTQHPRMDYHASEQPMRKGSNPFSLRLRIFGSEQ